MDGSLCSQSTEWRYTQDGSFVCQEFGWVGFFFPPWYFLLIGMQFRIETHLFFFFFNLRQRDLSLKGNTTSNKQH